MLARRAERIDAAGLERPHRAGRGPGGVAPTGGRLGGRADSYLSAALRRRSRRDARRARPGDPTRRRDGVARVRRPERRRRTPPGGSGRAPACRRSARWPGRAGSRPGDSWARASRASTRGYPLERAAEHVGRRRHGADQGPAAEPGRRHDHPGVRANSDWHFMHADVHQHLAELARRRPAGRRPRAAWSISKTLSMTTGAAAGGELGHHLRARTRASPRPSARSAVLAAASPSAARAWPSAPQVHLELDRRRRFPPR